MATKQNDPSFFITSTHRIIFPHLDAPHKFEDEDGKEDNEPKYDCTWLIPYNHPDAQAIMIAMQQMHAAEALSKFKGMPFDQIGQPDGIWNPLRVGDHYADKMIARGKDASLYEAYRGHYFLKATAGVEYPPIVYMQLDGDTRGRHEVMDIKREIYSGCYARGVLKGLAWANKGKYGFSWFINSACKTAEGPKLGGFSASADDYDVADTTDRNTLLPGEKPAAPVGFTMPGANLQKTQGVPPPVAQRPALPGMQPAAPVFTPPMAAPQQPAYAVPQPAYQAPAVFNTPMYAPPQPMAPPVNMPPAPMYAEYEGRTTVSFDGGANWEYAQ